MTILEQVEKLLPQLNRAEKLQLLESVAHELAAAPGVESHPGVCGGEPCVVKTRIPVWVLEQARRLGKSEAEILQAFPTLHAADLANAWIYVGAHVEEIDRQIRENEEA